MVLFPKRVKGFFNSIGRIGVKFIGLSQILNTDNYIFTHNLFQLATDPHRQAQTSSFPWPTLASMTIFISFKFLIPCSTFIIQLALFDTEMITFCSMSLFCIAPWIQSDIFARISICFKPMIAPLNVDICIVFHCQCNCLRFTNV